MRSCAAALVVFTAALGFLSPRSSAAQNLLTPVDAALGSAPPAPWRLAVAPKIPATKFERVRLDEAGVALRIRSEAGYGNWVHALAAPTAAGRLSWRWRVDETLPRADLRRKEGDDAAMKVCASFDLPLSALPFGQRQLLRLARSQSDEPLPSAVLCYVWDNKLPLGTVLPNAYTPLMRWWVMGGSVSGQWASVERDLAADFRIAFSDWWPASGIGASPGPVPAITAILIGADADNTAGSSLAWLQALTLRP